MVFPPQEGEHSEIAAAARRENKVVRVLASIVFTSRQKN